MPKLPPMPRGRRHSCFPVFEQDHGRAAEGDRMSRRCFCRFHEPGEIGAQDPARMFAGIARGLLRD